MGLVGRMLSIQGDFSKALSISNGSIISEGKVVSDENPAVIMQESLV